MAESLQVLAARAQLGDRAALENMLRELEGPLRAHIHGIVRDYDTVEDVLQETLIIIYRKLRSLADPKWVRPWSYRIATREAVRTSRKLGRDVDLSEELATTPDSNSAAGDFDMDAIERIHKRIDLLPVACGVVMRMRYVHSLSQDEIAEALSIPIGTVKSRIAYGLSILRKEMTAGSS